MDLFEQIVKDVKAVSPTDSCAVIVNSNRMADTISDLLTDEGLGHFKISGADIFNANVCKTAKAYLSVFCDDFRPLPWAQIYFRLTHKPNPRLRDIRRQLLDLMPSMGLLPSDLLFYDGVTGPASYVDDFASVYDGTLVVFDTETTGREIGEDDVIQIAAAKVKAGEIIDTMVLYLKTDRPIPPMLGDIPNPMVEVYEATKAEHLDAEEGIRKFLDFVGGLPVVGHNVEFACNMLESQLQD